MLWLLIAVSAYFLFALAALGDKVLLTGPLQNPRVYAVFVGVGGLLPIIATPVLGFPVPSVEALFLALASGFFYIAALLPFYAGIRRYEVSRIVPATGGLVPLIMFVLGLFILPDGITIPGVVLLAFALLIIGSIFLSLRHGERFSLGSLGYSFSASLLFGISFLLLKYAYLLQPFWSGFLWTQIGAGIAGILLLTSDTVRAEVRERLRRKPGSGRTALLFFGTQASAAIAGILQHVALFLVPAAYFAFVNALQGTQYLFLLLMAAVLSARYPNIFREENTGRALRNKIIGTLLIIVGVAVLVVLGPK